MKVKVNTHHQQEDSESCSEVLENCSPKHVSNDVCTSARHKGEKNLKFF